MPLPLPAPLLHRPSSQTWWQCGAASGLLGQTARERNEWSTGRRQPTRHREQKWTSRFQASTSQRRGQSPGRREDVAWWNPVTKEMKPVVRLGEDPTNGAGADRRGGGLTDERWCGRVVDAQCTLGSKMAAVVDALHHYQAAGVAGYLWSFPTEFFDHFDAISPVYLPNSRRICSCLWPACSRTLCKACGLSHRICSRHAFPVPGVCGAGRFRQHRPFQDAC